MAERTKLKNTFTYVYKTNLWGDSCSVSGPGSHPDQTKSIADSIKVVINKFEIKTMIDAPCGDFNWMKEIISEVNPESYKGYDIVRELIENNNLRYKADNISFSVSDLTTDILPQADLIICRDCFLHLSYRNIFYVMRNFKKTQSKFLLVSSYVSHSNSNVHDTSLPGRAVNLSKFPFKICTEIETLNENYLGQNGEYSDKSLLLIPVKSLEIWKINIRIIISEMYFFPVSFIRRFLRKILRKSKKIFLKIFK